MKKIKQLELWEEDIYTLSKEEALKILINENITKSEQMLLRWCRTGEIDAVRVVGAAVSDRGILIDPQSLKSFVTTKKGVSEVERLYVEIAQLKEEKMQLEARNEYLEKKLKKRGK